MAVVGTAKEIWQGRDGGTDDEARREFTRVWLVQTSQRRDGPKTVLAASGIPAMYSAYDNGVESDSALTLRSLNAEPWQDHPLWWKIVGKYSTATKTEDQSGGEEPTERHADVEWGATSLGRRAVERARNGAAIVNSAGDPFDPPLEDEVTVATLSIRRIEDTVVPSLPAEFQNKVNGDNFLGFGADMVKCVSITSRIRFERGRRFWETSYNFQIKPDFWTVKILDQGTHEKVGGQRRIIRDMNGEPVSKPVLLNGAGAPLPPGGNPVFLSFDVLTAKDFAALNLTNVVIS